MWLLEHFKIVGNLILNIPTSECGIDTYPRLLIHSTTSWCLSSMHLTFCIKPLLHLIYNEHWVWVMHSNGFSNNVRYNSSNLSSLNIALVFRSGFQIYRASYSFWQVHLWFVWRYCSLSEIMTKTSVSPCLLTLCNFKTTSVSLNSKLTNSIR